MSEIKTQIIRAEREISSRNLVVRNYSEQLKTAIISDLRRKEILKKMQSELTAQQLRRPEIRSAENAVKVRTDNVLHTSVNNDFIHTQRHSDYIKSAKISYSEDVNWIEEAMLKKYNIGKRKKSNPEYNRLNAQIAECYANGDKEAARKLKIERRSIPSVITHDDSYRRLRYVRYADDFILGFTGPKSEAEEIKKEIGEFLSNKLKLTLSAEKTLITNAGTKAARFLNYEIKVQKANDYINNGRRTVNGAVGLFVPKDVIDVKCAEYMKKGKTIHRGGLLQDDDFSIVERYQQEYAGVAQYYALAQNLC